MTAPAAARLVIRFAARDLRGGFRGFGVFFVCIALGVFAIAGVGSVAASLTGGIAAAGQKILGGDLAFTLIQRQTTTAEHAFLQSHGTVSTIATMRAMVRIAPSSPGSQTGPRAETLVELKAVDSAYPLFGRVLTKPAAPLRALLAPRDGLFGAVADPTLLTRFDLKPGDRIAIGKATLVLRASLLDEPDRLSGGIGFGPRVLISTAALQATGLVQPGSLVRWQYRLRLPAGSGSGAVGAVEKQAQTAFPDAGWEIRTRDNASPQLQRSIERFTDFLTLVALTTLLVGGIGVANAVASQLARKRDAIATMKALGATGGTTFAIYCIEILSVALLAAVAGAGLGAALPLAIRHWFGTLIPLPVVSSLHPGVLALAIGYGLVTAVAFALWPLGRAHDISVSMLFRDQIVPERRRPRARYVVAAALSVGAFMALTILTTREHRTAAIFIAAVGGVLLLLWIFAVLAMRIARRLPHSRSPSLRMAIGNLYRPGALTPTVMLSLGLGFALLTTIVEIDGNLHRELAAELPTKAPSFFLLDIRSADAARFDDFVRAHAPGATLERVPMLRGRIVAANGIPGDKLKAAPGSRWVLRGDRGITYSATVPRGSRVVLGHWWSAGYAGEPLVSLENKSAQGLGLKVGQTITVNVLGRDITARIANLRAVDWDNLGINFVLVYSPGAFAGAPHSDIATLTFTDGGSVAQEAAFLKGLAIAFPSVTAIRVKDALNTLDGILSKLIVALRSATSLTLFAGILVLGGALAAGQRLRIYDAVVLRVLGATRARLLRAYALEYVLVGTLAVLFGIAIGTLAAALIVIRMMELPFVFLWGPAAGAALAALLVTLVLGLAGTFAALRRKPAEVLRNF